MSLPLTLLSTLSPIASKLYLILQSRAQGRIAVAPIKTLALDARISPRTCKTAVAELLSANLIQRLGRLYHTPSAYLLQQVQPIAPLCSASAPAASPNSAPKPLPNHIGSSVPRPHPQVQPVAPLCSLPTQCPSPAPQTKLQVQPIAPLSAPPAPRSSPVPRHNSLLNQAVSSSLRPQQVQPVAPLCSLPASSSDPHIAMLDLLESIPTEILRDAWQTVPQSERDRLVALAQARLKTLDATP